MGFNYGRLGESRAQGRPTLTTATALIFLILQNAVTISDCVYVAEVQWTVGAPVTQYTAYSDVTLLAITIPKHTQDVFWILRSYSSSSGCAVRNATVFLQPGRYPVISPYNETFPASFHLQNNQWQEFNVPSSNVSLETTLSTPVPGSWYAAVIMKEYDTDDIQQQGFKKDCSYSFSLITVSKVVEDIWELSMEKSHNIQMSQDQERLYQYVIPDYTVQYDIQVSNCMVMEDNSAKEITPCPISMTFSEVVVPSNNSKTIHCSSGKPNSTCGYSVVSPVVQKPSYVKITRDTEIIGNQSLSFTLQFGSTECDRAEVLVDLGYRSNTDGTTSYNPHQAHPAKTANCLTPNSLGRYKIAPMDFTGVFLIHDFGDYPIAENQLSVSDTWSISTDFTISPVDDLGGTLKIGLAVRVDRAHMKQGSHIWLCLMKSRVPYKDSLTECPGGALLTVNTTSEYSSYSELYIPYPESGQWYLSLQSVCYNLNDTKKDEKCLSATPVEFLVGLSPCIEESCGRYGQCKEYISGVHIYSSCQCFAGWRGYGCTDGSQAHSDSVELASVLLLSLSNLFFIPGIIIALYRHYFVEALVYFFNMFFSTFYHACDSSKLYYYCIMKYDTLGFADFMGSIMSFWMTLMAMARLHPQLRSVFHMVGALCIALWMDFDRHGLWESIVPIFGGVFILLFSWGRIWYKRRELFPSKWRYIKFLLPGFLLAATGLIIFSFLETQQNYLYTHSTWHMVMALSIVFLLPPRRKVQKEHELLVNEDVSEDETRPLLTANMTDAVSLDREEIPRPIFRLGSRAGSDDHLVL